MIRKADGFPFLLSLQIVFLLLLALIAIADCRWRRIWHLQTLPAIALALYFGERLPAESRLNSLAGALAAFLLFLLIFLIANHLYHNGALGFGDVLLAALIGAIGGVVDGLLALAVGMLLAGAYAGYMLLSSRRGRRDRFAYGAFLAIGGIGLLLL